MDKLQREVMELNYKVERLSQIVERLSRQMESLKNNKEQQLGKNPGLTSMSSVPKIMPPLNFTGSEQSGSSSEELMIGHKDILNDEDSHSLEIYDYSPLELGMSCELQVQRLTAQLTAAYHRIAALEEQLLAKRSHS
jgi:hypothetical protein